MKDLKLTLEEKERQIQESELKDRQNLSVNQSLIANFKAEKEEVIVILYCIFFHKNLHFIDRFEN